MKKLYIFTITGLILLVGALGYNMYTQYNSDNQEVPATPSITGTVACLPSKTETTAEEKCMLGLKNKAGLYLYLKDEPQNNLKEGETISVEGELVPAKETDKYLTAGTIVKK